MLFVSSARRDDIIAAIQLTILDKSIAATQPISVENEIQEITIGQNAVHEKQV